MKRGQYTKACSYPISLETAHQPWRIILCRFAPFRVCNGCAVRIRSGRLRAFRTWVAPAHTGLYASRPHQRSKVCKDLTPSSHCQTDTKQCPETAGAMLRLAAWQAIGHRPGQTAFVLLKRSQDFFGELVKNASRCQNGEPKGAISA